MNYWLHPEAQDDLREAAEFYREKASTASSLLRTIAGVLVTGAAGSSAATQATGFVLHAGCSRKRGKGTRDYSPMSLQVGSNNSPVGYHKCLE
jgi:hypothetical protein